MPGKPIKIGPLKGGLNNISLSGESRDDEVVDLVNLEVALDGSLTSRPPIEALAGATLPSTNTIGWEVLGVYRVSSTEWYLVVTCPTDGTTNVNTTVKAYLNGIVGAGETVLVIKNSVGLSNRVTSMCQFKDMVHFNVSNGATDLGFRWKKGDAVGGTTNTAMPRGNILISWKSRLWVAGTGQATNGDRVFFSTVDGTGPHPETWTVASDFFDVAPGEGGFITAMIPSFNNIIIFKNDGTWRFTYATKPASGIVDKISGQVGCAGPNALVDFENYIYVYDQGRVYELMNSAFTQINRFVSFDLDPHSVDAVADGVELSVVNRRLVVRYFTAIYCFTIDTKVWSQWRTYSGTPGKFYELPADSASSESAEFMAASRGTMQAQSANLITDNLFKDADLNTARASVYNASVVLTNNSAVLTQGSDTAVSPTVLFNDDGTDPTYDIPVSTSQHFTISLNVDSYNIVAGANSRIAVQAAYLYRDGSTSHDSTLLVTATGVLTHTYTAPDGAILARVQIQLDGGPGTTVTLHDLNLNRTSITAPFNLMRIIDEYPDQSNAVEYIDCYFQTKSYDFQAASNWKRMFWAGMDVKTSRTVITESRPVSTSTPTTWDDMEAYTWDQLEQGTWDNPLDWLGISVASINIQDPDSQLSENGRYFKKVAGAMRFRQISYIVRMSSLGNKETGPAKFFSLTVYISPKEKVVDASN